MEDQTERVMLALLIPELLALIGAFALLSGTFLGWSSVFASYPPTVRLGALMFVCLELLIPLGVFLDIRRRDDDPDTMWVHAAAIPLINLIGVLAYLEDRQRSLASE